MFRIMYYVYILKSGFDGSKYIGATNNPKRRFNEHNSGGVRYTRAKKPYKIIWYSCFQNKEIAYKFEKYLKSSSGYAFTNKHLI